MAKNTTKRHRTNGDATAPTTPATTQVSFKIPTEWLARADRIAARLSRDAPPASRTDALRLAISHGFRRLEQDLGMRGREEKP